MRRKPLISCSTAIIGSPPAQGAIILHPSTSSAANAAAISLALTNLPPTGGVVVCDPGLWLVDHGFDIPPNTTIQGSGMTATVFELDPAVPPEAIFRTTGLLNGSFAMNVTISDLTAWMPHLRTGVGQRWVPNSGAFDYAVGAIVCPALAAPIGLRCKARNGVNGTGAFTPHGVLTPSNPASYGVKLVGTALANDRIWLRVITPGRLGTMVYETSRDGGANWVGPHATLAGVENRHTIAGTNYTLVLPDQPSLYLPAAVIHPAPPVVVSGTPAAEYVCSVYFAVGGPLGAAVFNVSVTTAARSQWGLEAWAYGPFATVAGQSSAHAIGATGLTVTCHAGDFTVSTGGANYLGPSYGWSLEDGSEVVDGGYTWEVLGPQRVTCIWDIGGATINYRNVRTIGGAVGLANCQSEFVKVDHCQFYNATGAQRWIDAVGDFQDGAGGGFSNVISDQDAWFQASDYVGWGLVHDGGYMYQLIAAHFTGNGSGWARLAGANAATVIDPYVEDTDGYTSNCSWAGRRSTLRSTAILILGGYYAVGAVVFDGHAVDGVGIYGTLYAATECFWRQSGTTNYDEAANQPNANSAPVFSRPWIPVRVPDMTALQVIDNLTRETVEYFQSGGTAPGGTILTFTTDLAHYAAGILGADGATVRVEWTIDTNQVIPSTGVRYAHAYRTTQIFSWGGAGDPKLTKFATVADQLEPLSVGAEGVTALSSDVVAGLGNEQKVDLDVTIWEPGTWPAGYIAYVASVRAKIDIFRRGHP